MTCMVTGGEPTEQRGPSIGNATWANERQIENWVGGLQVLGNTMTFSGEGVGVFEKQKAAPLDLPNSSLLILTK